MSKESRDKAIADRNAKAAKEARDQRHGELHNVWRRPAPKGGKDGKGK